jgi:hypothetical protein
MKWLAVLLFPSVAFTQTLKMENEAGGQIVLTVNQCSLDGGKYTSLYSVYGYARNGTTIRGCWAYIDGLVRVIWVNGSKRDESTYRMEDFVYEPRRTNP